MKHKLLFLLALMLLAVGPLWAQLQLIKEEGSHPISFNNETYYTSVDTLGQYEHAYQLWKTNGTSNVLVKQFDPQFEPDFYMVAVAGNRLFFTFSSFWLNGQHYLWSTDGTPGGTIFIRQIAYAPLYNQFFTLGNKLVYTVQGGEDSSTNEVYITDGTPEGTHLLKNFSGGPARIETIEVADNVLYIRVQKYYADYKAELWKSDGTVAGTQMIPSEGLNSVYGFAALNGAHYFIANGSQLRKIDGSAAGSVLIKNFTYASPYYVPVRLLATTSGSLYYSADDGVHGNEIWKTDGTSAGTVLVKDINPGTAGSNPFALNRIGNTIYFTANNGVVGNELWKTDGTATGTVLVKDINPGAGSSSFYKTKVGDGKLYFDVNDGANGWNVWGSDGTQAGTSLLVNLASPISYYYGTPLAFAHHSLYFAGQPEGNVRGLWRYTPGNTSTPPALVSTNPAPNAVSAARSANVALTFSQAMNAATASGAAVKVYGSQTGLRSGNFSGGGTSTVTFDPAKDFKPGEKVSVSVTKNARNTGGDSLVKAQVYDFLGAANPSIGTYLKTSAIALETTPKNAGSTVKNADLDGDGDLDIVLAYGKIFILTNDGVGNFIKTDSIPVAGNPSTLVTADLDGDGDTDILSVNKKPNFYSISVRFNNGSGTFSGYDQDATYDELYYQIITTDVDGDGDLDMVASNYLSVSIRKNDGTGHFSNPTVIKNGQRNMALTSADVDNDGDVDLIVVNRGENGGSENTFSVFKNDGSGNFSLTQKPVIGIGTDSNLVVAGDLDGDGDVDLIVNINSSSKNSIVIYINNGSGQFSASTDLALGYLIQELYLADVDGDGDLDLAILDGNWSRVHTRLNNGSAAFSVQQNVDLKAGVSSITGGDFNGDGQIDFAVVEDYASGLAILMNQPAPICFSSGTILREVWTKVAGSGVAAVPVNSLPDSTGQMTLFEAPSNVGDNYGSRMRGYICAPTTGSYIFWIASDNEAELYLSTDDNPANKVKIAFSNGFPNPREWDKSPSQKSAPIALEKGKRYYIEALHKEAYGNDNLSVGWLIPNGWQIPGGALERPIPGSRLSPFAPSAVCTASGSVLKEVWNNVSGNTIAEIPLQSAPSTSSQINQLQTPSNQGDKYAQRLRGYICAPETGNYTFWLVSDNEGELYLSSDDTPANKQLRASIYSGSAYLSEWEKYPSQKSATISLVAGQRYYLEVLHKEGYGGDNLAVGWRLPSSLSTAKPVIVPGSVLSPFVLTSARLETAEVNSAEEAAGLNLQAAPNPFSDRTVVSFTAQESGRALLELYDLQGKKLQQVFNGEVQAGEQQKAEVNGSRLGQGLYLLRLVNGSRHSYLKLLIEK